MSFTIKNVLELEIMKNARLLAGEAKKDNSVLWINVMEILDSFDSFETGELLVTTGFGLNDFNLHQNTIMHLAKKNLAGIAIQPGYYIDSVPQFIISEAEKYSFPLIELPKKLTFSNITKVILYNIGMYRAEPINDLYFESNLLSTILKKRHLSNTEKQLMLSTLKHNSDKTFICVILSFFEKELGILDSVDAEAYLDSITRGLESIGVSCLTSVIGRYYGIVISTAKEISPSHIEDLLNNICSQKNGIGENVLMYSGVSRSTNDLNGIYQGFQEAETSIEWLRHSSAKKGSLCFNNIELFRYICGQHTENAAQILEHVLSPLYSYDEIHRSDLVKTLRVFFASNMNYQDSAKLLFIHRHTMKYRINKIIELLNLDIESKDTRFKLALALYLDKYYK